MLRLDLANLCLTFPYRKLILPLNSPHTFSIHILPFSAPTLSWRKKNTTALNKCRCQYGVWYSVHCAQAVRPHSCWRVRIFVSVMCLLTFLTPSQSFIRAGFSPLWLQRLSAGNSCCQKVARVCYSSRLKL